MLNILLNIDLYHPVYVAGRDIIYKTFGFPWWKGITQSKVAYVCSALSLCSHVYDFWSCALSLPPRKPGAERLTNDIPGRRYAKMVNRVFNRVHFVQFFSSILVICTSVYYLPSHIIESKAATQLIYTISIFVQIFVYYWLENEVIFKVSGHLNYHFSEHTVENRVEIFILLSFIPLSMFALWNISMGFIYIYFFDTSKCWFDIFEFTLPIISI